jgi:two-component system, NarL family, sensor kinase
MQADRSGDEQLRRAERLIAALRASGLIAIGVALWRHPLATAPALAWTLYAASLGYALAVPFAFRRGVAIRWLAIATSVGDAVVILSLSAVSGGLASDVYFFAYTAVLAAAIRYGVPETFLSVALYGTFTVVLYFASPGATPYDLAIRLFFILFLAVMAGALSAEVKRHSREALAERDKSQVLLRRLIGAEEEERKRLAGEIHDRLGRRFFEFYHGIGRLAEALREREAETAAGLDRLSADARACADEIRNLANELRPSILDDFGFVEAMRESVAALEAGGEMTVRLRVELSRRITRPEVNVMLFRILQEAILNVRKHAAARAVSVDLVDDAGGGVRLSLRDDGRGFDPGAPARGHLGLLTMRERAEACGARLRLRSEPGRGSQVEVVVPPEAIAP